MAEVGQFRDESASQDHSSSAWNLSTKPHNSGVSTALLRQPPRVQSNLSNFSNTGVQPFACSSPENAILVVVQKQLESFEEKFHDQLNRSQQHNDRMREAAFSRLDEKVQMAEGMHSKIDRRLVELVGTFTGLSEEVQSQTRRIDAVDDRLWEWRHQLEEETRTKQAELEQSLHKVTSNQRVMLASIDETNKRHNMRVQRLEMDQEERVTFQEETRESILTFCSRLESIEERIFMETDKPGCATFKIKNIETLLGIYKTQLEDTTKKVESIVAAAHDVHMDIETHKERLRIHRTLLDDEDEKIRWLTDRVERSDLADKLDQVMRRLEAQEEEHKVFQRNITNKMKPTVFEVELPEEGVVFTGNMDVEESAEEALSAKTLLSDNREFTGEELESLKNRMKMLTKQVSRFE